MCRTLSLLAIVLSASIAFAQVPLHPAGHASEGLPVSTEPGVVYASEPTHLLNRLHARLFLAEVRPTEVGASLPAERAREAQADDEFFTGKWYFRNRKGDEITEADTRAFGGDVRVSPVLALDGARGVELQALLAAIDTREEVEALAELRSPLARVLLQWDLLFVGWRVERRIAQGKAPLQDGSVEARTLAAMARAIRALALPRETLLSLGSGIDALPPRGSPERRAESYVPAGLLSGERGAWREIARDEKELFHATNSLRAARVFVRAADGEATERLVRRSAAATDEASTPVLDVGTEAALVMSLVVLDDTLTPVATEVVDEVRIRRVTGPGELRPGNGSSRDGWSHWVHMLSRPGALLGRGERFRFVPDTSQALFLEYGSPKHTTYFAQCALCHRRTNSGGQDPDGIRALGRYGHPALESDGSARRRLAERQFEPIAKALRRRLGGQ